MRFAGEAPRIDASGAFPLGNDVRWIEMSPAFLKAQRRQTLLAAVLLPLLVVSMVAIPLGVLYARNPDGFLKALGSEDVRDKLVEGVLYALLMVLATPVIAMVASRRLRLGSSAAGLHYEVVPSRGFSGTPRTSVPWRKVLYDGRWLVADRKRFILRGQSSVPVFDAEELRKVILANIPKENLLTPSQLQKRLMGPLTWVLLAAVLAMLAWVLLQAFASR